MPTVLVMVLVGGDVEIMEWCTCGGRGEDRLVLQERSCTHLCIVQWFKQDPHYLAELAVLPQPQATNLPQCYYNHDRPLTCVGEDDCACDAVVAGACEILPGKVAGVCEF